MLRLIKLTVLLLFCVLQLRGQAGPIFQGQVLDRADYPMASATIELKSPDQTLETKTDTKGHFAFVASPGTYELTVSARGFADRTVQNLKLSEASSEVRIFLDIGPMSISDPVGRAKNYKPGERLDGTVMDEFGAFITNASVTLKSAKKTLRSKSDPNGDFAFRHVPVGNYWLTISAEGFQSKTIDDVKITREDLPSLRVILYAAVGQ